MNVNAPLIEARSLAKSYDYKLFENIDITLWSKQSIAIMGRSGSGKSTLLHILATLLKADKGYVKLLGKDTSKLKESEIVQLRREALGIIFQSHYLFKGMTARENIQTAAYLANTQIDIELLKDLEIDKVLDKKVGQLSGGQQQRVSIARVLTKKPTIIFADEPTGNLDKTTANLVIDILNNYILKHNAALFLVTHDLEIAKKAQKIYLLEDGTLHMV
jgi:putative ABC transport system ATP-binding protein